MLDPTLDKPIEELEGDVWDEPDENATGLVLTCHRLRKVPIGQLSDDDLRLLLGQRIGAEWLVPITLDRLAEDPLAGDLYPSDLLKAVLRTPPEFWPSHPDLLARLHEVKSGVEGARGEKSGTSDQLEWPPSLGRLEIAQADMVRWLAFPTELEGEPDEIELVKIVQVPVDATDGDLYVFRFRTYAPHWAAAKNWMIGISGPFPRTMHVIVTDAAGWTFSRLEPQSAMSIDAHVRQLIATVTAFRAFND